MMNNVLLIDPDFVRSMSNVSDNLQDKFLHTAIRETTDVDYHEVVGTKMLNKLKDLVVNNTIGNIDNKKYKDLLDASKYFLTYATITRIVVISSVKLDNIGANMTSDINAQSLPLNDVFKVESYYEKKADYYKDRLQAYIRKHKDNFTEFDNDIYDVDENDYSAASCSVFLGGARGKSYTIYQSLQEKYE